MENEINELKLEYQNLKEELDRLYLQYNELKHSETLVNMKTDYDYLLYKYDNLEKKTLEVKSHLRTILLVNNYILSLQDDQQMEPDKLSTLINLQNSIIDTVLSNM